MDKTNCPCQSGKLFSHCCQGFLSGEKRAPTPSKLMRSRFSAFSLGGYGGYLLSTWHPDYRGQLDEQELSIRSTDWQGLEVINSTQQGSTATVEFIASFNNIDGSRGTHHEVSNFVRVQGRWLYSDGTVLFNSDANDER